MKYYILIIPMIFVLACNTGKKHELSKEQMLGHIDSLEVQLRSATMMDKELASAMYNSYTAFVSAYPEDEHSADYLFKAADVSSGAGLPDQAVHSYQEIIKNYPTFKKIDFCYFLTAFVYETQLKNLDKAKEFYTLVVQKFPESKLVNDAKASIENLGKSDEELLKMFEEKNKEGAKTN